MRAKQKSDGKGSLRDIQLLVNNYPGIIDKLIKSQFSELANDEIIWQSPLQTDDFAEYRDNDFIDKIGLDRNEINLNTFWPNGGPQWDALATTTSKAIILVEAKANIPEIVSSPSGASSPKSIVLIEASLMETKEFLGLKNDVDWSGTFYQYTNRLAHLYFLRQKHKKAAYLINVYFIGDKSVNGPLTVEEWKGALQVMNTYPRPSRHKLSKYTGNLFIDVKKLDHHD